MTIPNNPDPLLATSIRHLQDLAGQATESSATVQRASESMRGILVSWVSNLKGELPEWAENHIAIHKQLKEAVNAMEAKGEGDKIPEDVLQALQRSNEVVNTIANKVNATAYLNAILPDTPTVDDAGLLTSDKTSPIPSSQQEWHLNLGLLMNAYNRTKDPALKKQIEFLALNYLAKAAPINISELGLSQETTEKLEDMFQLGMMTQAMSYHREASIFEGFISTVINQAFANDSRGRFWLTDTAKFEELLPTFFNVVETPHVGNMEELTEVWSDGFADAIVDHMGKHPEDPLFSFLQPPILFDLTDLLDDCIRTDGDPEKEAQFTARKHKIEHTLEAAIESAIHKLKAKDPELIKTPDDEQKLRVYLKANFSCIYRGEWKGPEESHGVGILKRIDFFTKPEHFRLPESMFGHGEVKFLNYADSRRTSETFAQMILGDKDPKSKNDFESFVNHTGIRIGGVRGREKVFNFISLRDLVRDIGDGRIMTEYAVPGKNVVIFERKNEIERSKLFTDFKEKMDSAELAERQPQIAILGKATLDIFAGLLKDIPEEKWNELNLNPDTRMLLQQSLFRSMQHLAAAKHNMDDFTAFSQAIELVHCEIATILSLTSPFKEEDFQGIYKAALTVVPEQFQDHLTVGVAKSAMNIFAGANVALLGLTPKPERVYGECSYFEEVSFIGENRMTQDVVANPEIKAVDLYVGEFNHNVNISLGHEHYSAGKVIQDIELLLEEKKDTKHLTVAIDVTIDFMNSPKAKEVLEHFSKEIEEGKLNFLFFRSGQKFDMLGMDNYYGAPYWMVNNGGDQWEGFKDLTTSEVYKTDPLSMQWFCLANKHAPQALDDYRGQIFQNARTILSQVPPELKPGGSPDQEVRISTVADEMDPAFIDIKILNDHPEKTLNRLQRLLYDKFAERGAKMHSRGSFGFYHPNFNVIPAIEDMRPRNIRINPGLNEEENQIIIDFMQDIPRVLAELK